MKNKVNLILEKYFQEHRIPNHALSANLKDLRSLNNKKNYLLIGSSRWKDEAYTLVFSIFKNIILKEVEMPDINKKLDQIVALIKINAQNITSIQNDVSTLKEDVKVLKEDVKVLKEDVTVLKEDVKVLKEDVTILKEDVKVLKEDVTVLKEDMVIVKADIKVLKEDMIIVKSVPIIKAAFENQ